MCHSVKNYKSKSHSLNAAHDQKTSLAQKKLVHAALLLTFAFRSSERIVFPVKKNLKENQYSSSSRKKNQEKANNSPSYRCAAINNCYEFRSRAIKDIALFCYSCKAVITDLPPLELRAPISPQCIAASSFTLCSKHTISELSGAMLHASFKSSVAPLKSRDALLARALA